MNQTNPQAAAMKPLNILIVDDSATMRALLYRVVGLADLPIGAIYQAPNGAEALKILETAASRRCSPTEHAGDERDAAAARDGQARRVEGYAPHHHLDRRVEAAARGSPRAQRQPVRGKAISPGGGARCPLSNRQR